MNVDRYTKAVLTVIALALLALAVEQASVPRASASPTPVPTTTVKFDNVTYAYGGNSISFFDKSTGDLWYYGGFGSEEQPQHMKLNKLGEPLQKDK